jgi:hypothetical protein
VCTRHPEEVARRVSSKSVGASLVSCGLELNSLCESFDSSKSISFFLTLFTVWLFASSSSVIVFFFADTIVLKLEILYFMQWVMAYSGKVVVSTRSVRNDFGFDVFMK